MRRRGRSPQLRWLRVLAIGTPLVLMLPVAWIVAYGLAHGRDLPAAWRALRAPAPAPVAAPASTLPAPFGPALHVGSLLDPELVEVSGLAASRRRPNLLWAVNDGGNEHRLYALSHTGALLRSFDVAVPEDRSSGDSDWEALAGFAYEGAPYLLIADVGDNWSWRRSVRLWIVEEPELATAEARLVPRWRIELVYEGGARDCEAVAVDEETATALLISKRTAPPVVYAAALAPLLRGVGGQVVAHPLVALAGIPPPSTEFADALARAMLHMPTALDLAPDGSAAVVLSYAAGWRFPRAPGQSWAEAFAGRPERITLPPLPLAEAVAYSGASLFITGEMEQLALVRWRAPLMRLDPLASPEPAR